MEWFLSRHFSSRRAFFSTRDERMLVTALKKPLRARCLTWAMGVRTKWETLGALFFEELVKAVEPKVAFAQL